ncbi:NADP-dependent isocitrate dehydrogenase [Buchananella hordeovulneris]|uniref:NADP-dependent isocitrate dehydrogenase n=1 Tax=Buchananella hordeovulneris TaxID=52770 RepID=UPI000F5D57DE|nr:NADP-dependent isocitrate dehydrogenase [Buchananella hordeovulneris]RRD52658.1 NADP-dependent isocitrate dehydrogenase [Buchananella hordeovulneris]
MSRIVYTYTDEAPALATASLLPIVEAFARTGDIEVVTRDISLAGRILAAFPEQLEPSQRQSDDLAELGELTQQREANIIKLPNISASLPQLKAAISELQGQGYAVPAYPDSPTTPEQTEIRRRYDAIKGSAVNPVLREGNSDRRAPRAVKAYAQANPHRMGAWSPQCRTNVATMSGDDFRAGEQSVVLPAATQLTIRHVTAQGAEVLAGPLASEAGDVVDATVMRAAALRDFLTAQVARARAEDLLFSLHLKATMMKVSDPVLFGHAVRAFFPRTFAAHGQALTAAGLHAEDGLATIFAGLEQLADGAQIRAAFDAELADGPRLSMVNSAQGVTNLHVPSDVIVDASMPAMIRNGGRLWGPQGEEADTLAVIPDSSYAGVYQAVIDDCRAHGALDPRTLGTVPNVGLMAGKAEEYGSHPTTFVVPADGVIEVVDGTDTVLLRHEVASGDIWRLCRTKDAAIRDWVALAVRRARASATPAIFWLDPTRAHDRNLQELATGYLAELDTADLDITFADPVSATRTTLARLRRGTDTISVTGNVLRDYLTDLFPILELGTSAKMLSIVPLMAGGGLFETGAGGSAPRHVAFFREHNYLRWDSLGEFLALAESFRQVAHLHGNARAELLAAGLEQATERVLLEGRSPARQVGQIDNRGSHLWLATYWARALADQDTDPQLAAKFAPLAAALEENVEAFAAELVAAQGRSVDLGGYYHPDTSKVAAVLRPIEAFNNLLAAL